MGWSCCSGIGTKSHSHFNIKGVSESDNQVLHFQYGVPIDTKRLYYMDQIRRTISQRRMDNAFSYDRKSGTKSFNDILDLTLSLTPQELHFIASSSLKMSLDLLAAGPTANGCEGESGEKIQCSSNECVDNNNTKQLNTVSLDARCKQTTLSKLFPLIPLMPPAEHYDRQRVPTETEQVTLERLVAAMERARGCLQAAASSMLHPNNDGKTIVSSNIDGWQVKGVSWLVTLEKTIDAKSKLTKKGTKEEKKITKDSDDCNLTEEKIGECQGEEEVDNFFGLDKVSSDPKEKPHINGDSKTGKRVHFSNNESDTPEPVASEKEKLKEAMAKIRQMRLFPSTTVEIASVNYNKSPNITRSTKDDLLVSVFDVTPSSSSGSTPNIIDTSGEAVQSHLVCNTEGKTNDISSEEIAAPSTAIFHVSNNTGKVCSDNSNAPLRNLLISSEVIPSSYSPSLIISAQWWYFLATKSLVPSDHPYFRGYVVPPIFARMSDGSDNTSFIVDSIPPNTTPTVCSSNYNYMKSSSSLVPIMEVSSLDEEHCVYGEALRDNVNRHIKQALPVGPPIFPFQKTKGKKKQGLPCDLSALGITRANKNAKPNVSSSNIHLPHSDDPLADLDLRNLVAWPPTASPANPSVVVLPGKLPRPKRTAASTRVTSEHASPEEKDDADEYESVVVMVLFAHRRGPMVNCANGSKELKEFSRRTQEDGLLPMSFEPSITNNSQFNAIAGGSKPALKMYNDYIYQIIQADIERKVEALKKPQPGRECVTFPLVGGCGQFSLCCPEKAKEQANTSHPYFLHPYSTIMHAKCLAKKFQSVVNSLKQQAQSNPAHIASSFSPYSDQGGWVGNCRYMLATSPSSHLKRPMLHQTNSAELRLDPVSVVVEAFCVELSLKRKQRKTGENQAFSPPSPMLPIGNETIPGVSSPIGAVSNSQGFLDIVEAIGIEIQREVWGKDLFPL